MVFRVSGDVKMASLLPQSATKSASNIYHHQLVLYQPPDLSTNVSQSLCHGIQKQRGVSVPNLGSSFCCSLFQFDFFRFVLFLFVF